MEGKIFPESSNLYQDEAKILFNYYRQAAEKIVAEEERYEKEIAQLREQRAVAEDKLGKVWYWFFTIILFFMYFIKKGELTKQIADIDARIAEFQKLHAEIFRDYKVSRLGVAYVPVADQIKYEDKSFIVDYTGAVADSEIKLQLSRRNDLLIETIGKLEKLSDEAPVVETGEDTVTIDTDDYSLSIQQLNQYDYLGALDRSLKTIAFCMDDLDTAKVDLPLVADNSSYLHFLKEFATGELPETAPVIYVFDMDKYNEDIEKFRQINKLRNSLSTKTKQFEDVLKQLMVVMARSVQEVSALKVASVDKVVLESNKLLYNILKSPYNHYSPNLEFEEIDRIKNEKFDYSEDVQGYEPFQLRQSSRVKYNAVTGQWVAEDGSTTNVPFGVHQLYEEIVAPVVQNLMMETRIERLKIYNHIKDQKISYLNKWHQDTDAFYRANRAESADIINLMQESLREYVAAYNTLISLKRTEESMEESGVNLDSTVVKAVDNSAETLAAFELQAQGFQKTQSDFEEYMERLKEDIDEKAAKFGHIKYYDGQLRDGYSNEVAVAASEVNTMDPRRRELAGVNPLLAKSSALPPQPSVEELTFEHISLNLPSIARNALERLENDETPLTEKAAAAAEVPVPQAAPEAPEVPEAPVEEPAEAPMPPAAPEIPVVEEEEIEETVAEAPAAPAVPTIEEEDLEDEELEEEELDEEEDFDENEEDLEEDEDEDDEDYEDEEDEDEDDEDETQIPDIPAPPVVPPMPPVPPVPPVPNK